MVFDGSALICGGSYFNDKCVARFDGKLEIIRKYFGDGSLIRWL
jgi:hypothetical protein